MELQRFNGPGGSTITVVRDDLTPGGTKSRAFERLFVERDAGEVVYASPCEGGAQFALATVARRLGRKATIVCAGRAKRHDRTREAIRLGANVLEVRPGYLSVVQARAADYARKAGALLVPFGAAIPETFECVRAAALSTGLSPAEVWLAAGSGTLARALALAWPEARFSAVQIGRDLAPGELPPGAELHKAPVPYETAVERATPFPADPHYEAKAWRILLAELARRPRDVTFWNVAGPARP